MDGDSVNDVVSNLGLSNDFEIDEKIEKFRNRQSGSDTETNVSDGSNATEEYREEYPEEYPEGYTEEYSEEYPDGYPEGYAEEYTEGCSEEYADGYADEQSEEYAKSEGEGEGEEEEEEVELEEEEDVTEYAFFNSLLCFIKNIFIRMCFRTLDSQSNDLSDALQLNLDLASCSEQISSLPDDDEPSQQDEVFFDFNYLFIFVEI